MFKFKKTSAEEETEPFYKLKMQRRKENANQISNIVRTENITDTKNRKNNSEEMEKMWNQITYLHIYDHQTRK